MKIFAYILAALMILNSARMNAVNHTALADQISKETVKILEEKYHLQMVGWGGGTMHGVERLSLSFQLAPPVSISQARKLVVECTEIFLAKLNSNKELRPYLAEYPFPVSRVKLDFYVANAGKYKAAETLSSFGISWYRKYNQMMITYSIYDREKILKDVLIEPYEDDKKLLADEKKNQESSSS